MGGESYTLREIAELLGVSKRTLQRRIREGAFPGRYLAPGRHGMETRVPAEDVERALAELQQEEPSRRPQPLSVLSSAGPQDALVPLRAPAAASLTVAALRDTLLEIVRSEREVFLEELQGALSSRDEELRGLRGQMRQVQEAVEGLRTRLEAREALSTRVPSELPGISWQDAPLPVPGSDEELRALLDELEAIEALVGRFES